MMEVRQYLLTPRSQDNSERYSWQVSGEDLAKIARGRPWTAIITNLTDRRRYKVRGASCGLPRCFCDAVVLQEVMDKAEGG